jgi:hypothetical protein
MHFFVAQPIVRLWLIRRLLSGHSARPELEAPECFYVAIAMARRLAGAMPKAIVDASARGEKVVETS